MGLWGILGRSDLDPLAYIFVAFLNIIWSLFAIGIHSCVIISSFGLMLLSLYLSEGVDMELKKNLPTLAHWFGYPAILMIMCEVTSAYYFQILRKNIFENERLLNDSTASCIVNRLSGCIN